MIAEVTVLSARPETPTTHAVRFSRPPGFDFRPVQFVGLELDTEEGRVEYSMSLASSPTRDHLDFGARDSGTPWKRAFASLRPGDRAEIDGPYGHFVLDEGCDAVLVAGGIGITPLKGMAEYAVDRRLGIGVRLLYSNRSPDDIPFRAELDALAAAHPGFRVTYTVTRPPAAAAWAGRAGRIDEAMLADASRGLDDPAYYLCGTPGMVASLIGVLRGMGVGARRIHEERFWGYE